MSNETLIDCLDLEFYTTDSHGLVNFNNIANLIGKTSGGVPSLLRKGPVTLVKDNLVNMNQGDETRVIHKTGTTYFVDRRLAIAFLKSQRPDLHAEVSRWEAVYGRADIPNELGQRAPALFRHILDVFGASNFRCTFKDKWYFCLNDVIQAATGDGNNALRSFHKAVEFDPSISESITKSQKFG